MLHEVSFPSSNKRDEVQGWIYVPAARPKGIVQIIHGFGEHSRRYLHMISKFMDAGFIVAADDHVGHGKTAMVSGVWGDWGDAGFHTMMEDEHTLKELVCEKYPNPSLFPFPGTAWAPLSPGITRQNTAMSWRASPSAAPRAVFRGAAETALLLKRPWTTAWGPIPIRNLPAPSWAGSCERCDDVTIGNEWICSDPYVQRDHAEGSLRRLHQAHQQPVHV